MECGLFFAVLPNRFYRAAFQSLHAQGRFFFGRRLLVHIGVASFIMAGEKAGRGLAAKIAVDALLIDVEFTWRVLRPFVRFVGHNCGEQRVNDRGVKRARNWRIPPENSGAGLCLQRGIPSFSPMLSDRPYMREDYPRNQTSAVTWLISAVVAVVVLQYVFLRVLEGSAMLERLLRLSPEGIREGKVWTLFTYSFLHSTSNLLHVVSNLLGLYFLGRALQPLLGSKRLMWLYVGCVVSGGILWLATHWSGSGAVIGASAGVLGLFTVFAAFHPNRPMTFLLFFVLPVTLKPKYVAFALLGFELLGFVFYEIMGAASPLGTVAYSAHLGGMLAGWLYFRYLHDANWRTASASDIELPRWFKKTAKTSPAPTFQVDVTRREDLRAEVDRILDKINSDGFGALTADEKRLLDEARELLSRR